MNIKTPHVLRFILLLLLGVFLIWLSLSRLELHDLSALLLNGNYTIVLPVFVVSVSSYYFRILRWNLLYRSMNEQPRKSMLFASLCTGYLVSFAVPRLGELVRCLMMKKADSIPFNKSLISIVIERTVDMAVLMILLAAVVFFYNNETTTFITQHIWEPLRTGLTKPAFLIFASVVAAVAFLVFLKFRSRLESGNATRFYTEARESVKSILLMPHPGKFFALTLAIWFCYFLMTWLWLFTFNESMHLGIGAAFVVMVIGSIGRSVPIQGGGMGAYHFLVSNAFALFGLTLLTGNALAIVIHGAQAVFTFITGSCCIIWFLLHTKKDEI